MHGVAVGIKREDDGGSGERERGGRGLALLQVAEVLRSPNKSVDRGDGLWRECAVARVGALGMAVRGRTSAALALSSWNAKCVAPAMTLRCHGGRSTRTCDARGLVTVTQAYPLLACYYACTLASVPQW